MTSVTLERILQDARRLPTEEQQELIAALEANLPQRSALSPGQRQIHAHDILAQVDALAHEIEEQWQGGGTAVDVVREGRREL